MDKKVKYPNPYWALAGALFSAAGAALGFAEYRYGFHEHLAEWQVLLGVVGAILLLIVFFRNLQIVHRLKQQNENLERQYHEANLEIAKVQNQARQEAEEMRSTLAHGLRMPLSIIQGYADLLSGDMVPDEEVRKEYLEKITQRCQYMTEILSRQFSFQDTVRKGKLHYERLDLLQLVHQSVGDMQTTAREHGIGIRVITQEQELPVEVDGYLINQILFNLMENAIKYMGRPGSISLLVLKQDKNVTIRVKDDGIGLSPEETEHIFEHHFQGQNRTSGKGHGLYLVRQIVEAHGGTITASSAVGQGMGISITLPRYPAGT